LRLLGIKCGQHALLMTGCVCLMVAMSKSLLCPGCTRMFELLRC
jgi:hypothetical protein